MTVPVVVFGFDRPLHLSRCLESIQAASQYCSPTKVYVYLDGPRDTGDNEAVKNTRRIASSFAEALPITIHESKTNLGLKTSLEAGISTVMEKHGRAVVVEDDLVLHPLALAYFEDSLNLYRHNPRVFQISGFQFAIRDTGSCPQECGFLPIATSWGWASWARAWKHYKPLTPDETSWLNDTEKRNSFNFDGAFDYASILQDALENRVNSWAIHWYARIWQQGGLTLFPYSSLVKNAGFDGSGTHCLEGHPLNNAIETMKPWRPNRIQRFPSGVEIDSNLQDHVQTLLRTMADNSAVSNAQNTSAPIWKKLIRRIWQQ